MNENLEKQLKELMLDEDFTSLQNLVNDEVNLMDILKVSHKELQHSNFLAWLFNPNESHNLGDFVLKEFIKIYFKENQYQNLGNEVGLSVFDFVLYDFDDLEIRREYKNIDLVLLSKKNKFCIVIENKIYSNEKKGQLEKYRTIIENDYSNFKHKIYIFLSLYDQEISVNEQNYYVQLNYEHLIKLIEQVLLRQQLKLADNTRFICEQYLQTLKSMLNKNEEIEQVAQKLYKKYKSAFDLVFKYAAPTSLKFISNKLIELINKNQNVRPFKSNNTYVRFQPEYLHNNLSNLIAKGLISSSDDLSNNWVFLYEFNIRKNKVNFDLKIGKGDSGEREKIYEIYKRNQNLYDKVNSNKKLSSEWHLSYQKTILTSEDLQEFFENENNEIIESKLEKQFNELINNELPNLMKVFDSLDK